MTEQQNGATLLVLNDTMVAKIFGRLDIQEAFPALKAAHAHYTSTKGCRCNAGRRKREAIQRAKTSILELSAEGKSKFKQIVGAKNVRLSGIQHGKHVLVTF